MSDVTGSEASAQEVRRAASTIAAAQSAAVGAVGVPREGRTNRLAATAVSPTATTTPRRRTRFGEEALSEQGLGNGPQLIPLSPPNAHRTASRIAATRPTSPPMEVFGAMLPPLDDDPNNNDNDGATSRPIAQRTRAHVSLMDVTIEELEDQLAPAAGLNEPLLYFGVDDAAEWERFLAGLQSSLDYGVATGAAGILSGGGGDGANSNKDGSLIINIGAGGGGTAAGGGTMDTDFEDSDDEDFVVELERMLQEDEAARLHHGFDMNLGISLPDDFFNYNNGGGNRGGGGKFYNGGRKHGKYLRSDGVPRTLSRKRQRIERPPRRSARLRGNTVAERPLYMASLLDRRTGRATAAALQQRLVENSALQQAYGPTTNENQAPMFAGLDELATLAASLAIGPPIPLPSDMGKPGAAAAAKTVVWRPPLPKAMRKYDLSAQPDENAPIIGAHFQASQYSDLYLSIHYHVQLLSQTTAMAAATGDAEALAAGAQLLKQMGQFVAHQTNSRKASGIPAYVSACLGIDTGEGLGEDEEPSTFQTAAGGSGGGGAPGTYNNNVANGSRQLADDPNGQYRRWTPQNPGNIYTVADVSVLRAVPRMLELLPSVGGGSGGGAAAAAAAGEPSPSSNLENRQPGTATTVRTSATVAAEENKKRRRRGKVARQHPIWGKLPADVNLALVPVRRFFDLNMEPMPPTFPTTSQMLFTPAEDYLLAWGIRKHLYDWAKIAAELLPTKDAKILLNRKKNRCTHAAPDNIVKEVVSLITGELTLAEELLIVQALDFHGKERYKWDVICKEHLPHRSPRVLSMLWSDRQRKIEEASGGGGGDGNATGGPRGRRSRGRRMVLDAATVTAAAAAVPRANQGLVMNGDGGVGGNIAAADRRTAEMMAQQHQYFISQQMSAAAIGAGLLPHPHAAAAAAAAAAALETQQHQIQNQQQPQPQQRQQVSPETAAAAAEAEGVAPPRLVEWEQQPGQEVEEVPEQQTREAPPRNLASQLHDLFTGRAVPAEGVWSTEEDKSVLRAALANGGALGEEKLNELENTLKRGKEELFARSEVLVERFLEKARQERQRQQAAAV
jgi:hypothetical protein